MKRLDNRRSTTLAALAAGSVLGAVALTGCGSGQLSQTAAQVPAVNGTGTVINNVALRNVHIQATQTGDFLEPGKTVNLVLVAVNDSVDVADKLLGITSDIGPVTVSGDTALAPGGTLFVGTADGQSKKAVEAIEPAGTAKAIVALNKPITNGLLYNFTFDFEKAGRTSLTVPISAGLAPRQEETPVPAEHP